MKKMIPFLMILGLLCCKSILGQEESLPLGSYPPAIPTEHLPNRLYAFVWRNWNLVDPEIMGKTIGCNAEDIINMAASMGLPPYKPNVPDFDRRIYITVIRRNWHLLPYAQLLILLNMNSNELSVALKEDDALFIKLGNLKPQIEELKYTAPDKNAIRSASKIKRIAQQYFRGQNTFPPFQFIEDLRDASGKKNTNVYPSDKEKSPRIVYSYFGIYGDPLSDTLQDLYPDGLMEKLSQSGVNGIWMHVVLNQIAPGGTLFPEFGEGHALRIQNLNRIVERAKRYGIDIYLYINEPRAMDSTFFINRAPMRGTREGNYYAMCTSSEEVQHWMRDALAYVFSNVPGLGGVLTITASENFTNCASHGNQKGCERCSRRSYAEIIGGVNRMIEEGVHKGNPDAKVIVWDWGWHNHGLAPDVIAALPDNVYLMSVSEWAKPIERGGVNSEVGEYSISAVGPGPRALQNWKWAKERGLKTMAKVQVNNTWELSSVPWLPVPDLVMRHMTALSDVKTDGLMLSWSLGGYPSPTLKIADRISNHSELSKEEMLNELAEERYGRSAVKAIRKAWTAFSNAFEQFPYGGHTLYNAPQQLGPANLLYEKPTGYKATMVGFPYDDLQSWKGVYPANIFAQQFKKVADGWIDGLKYFKQAIAMADSSHRIIAMADEDIAKAAYLHFASVANQVAYIINRDKLLEKDLSSSDKIKIREELRHILKQEIQLASELFEICSRDSRIGYEASNQYYYVLQDLVEKVINCNYLLHQLKL
ncbi:hypothetical protein DC498_08235 [Terrimonas sp.]|uniref:hypothetical protein n=1 Tax=Terrimonas sp. TaxID=1914338 RepID=UPI000D5063DD|nr:hypothetical protein [Terrimonas sp.]PVD52924.1 hypothetical protein DC498_08235 [Terrimonas sp.]